MKQASKALDTKNKIPCLPGAVHVVTPQGQPGFVACSSCGQLTLEGVTAEGLQVWLTPVTGSPHAKVCMKNR
jgi:hypothetical protein